ncbi:NF-kappa-B-repressing factor [Tenebrio molitor]|jgi:hypothetical protein|uniref:NF-kappa-B-repressing factor n=1 Tax=Tenebrio molitor TaxID=7067 RepID=UPI0036248D21
MSTELKRKLSDHDDDKQCRRRKNGGENNLEEKISRLVNEVQAQDFLGNLVVILHDENENPYVTLQNALSYINITLKVVKNDENPELFELQINEKAFACGSFQNMQLAKRPLAEEALEKLKETCFFISKKSDYVNVTKENLSTSSAKTVVKPSVNSNSIALKIMTKMGWTGGGLGAQEQGNLDSVMLYENVNRHGLGNRNLMTEITKKLDEFCRSSNLLTLVFDSDFTKEERVLIHKVARKFNLKSKSSGTSSRKITVSHKITRMDIVKELLKIGGEDGLYKLHIPTKFMHLWDL